MIMSQWMSRIHPWEFPVNWTQNFKIINDLSWDLKNRRYFFIHFYPAEFTPDGVLSSLYSYVRPYVRPSEIFFEIFVFLGILTLVVLDDFFIFWKKWFFGPATPFFWPFFWYIRAYSGRASSQVIYAGKVLFADFEST